ncbi:helix-turn-helix domain-containing protein [Rhizobium sp. BK251]|uniref:helix-turn-helix domain-containing protein n=1 Tax=Rhizobium sp. BK251 TaxID=2512125 RepID=UPI0032AFAC80
MQFVLRRLDNAVGRRRSMIDDLTAELGISERSLRRRCHEVFGYGARTLDRILRFQRFLQQVRATTPCSLAWLAAEAGYADQAHMTREVRDMSGLTPAAVVRQFKGPLAVSFNTGAVRTPYLPRMEVEHVHDDGKDRSSIC